MLDARFGLAAEPHPLDLSQAFLGHAAAVFDRPLLEHGQRKDEAMSLALGEVGSEVFR